MVTDLLVRVLAALGSLLRLTGDSLTSGDMIYKYGKASDAILYSLLFMPDLVKISDSILLAWSVSDTQNRDRFLSQISEKNVDISRLESSFNFVEMGYLFEANGRDTNDEQDFLLAELLCLSWKQHLESEYPNRIFVVEVLDPEITGSTVGVHFFEAR